MTKNNGRRAAIKSYKRKNDSNPDLGSNSKKRKTTQGSSKKRVLVKNGFIVRDIQKVDNTVIDLSDDDDDDNDKISDPNPVVLRHERITIFKNDLSCLEKNQWLKDNIVDFMLNNLIKENEKQKQAYLFNSLFFAKLQALKEENNKKKCFYNETQKWFKNDALSNRRFWIIPVCDQFHWYTIVIARPRTNKPEIFVLDSLRKKSYESVSMIQDFLRQKYAAEHQGKCKKINSIIVPIPQQNNSNDCGLYTIRSAHIFISSRAQLYHNLIKDYQNNLDDISKIYQSVPLPTRDIIKKKIKEFTSP